MDEGLVGFCNESSCMCCSPIGSHYEVEPDSYCPAGFCDTDGGTCSFESLRNLTCIKHSHRASPRTKVEEFDEILEVMEDSLAEVCEMPQSCSVLECLAVHNLI